MKGFIELVYEGHKVSIQVSHIVGFNDQLIFTDEATGAIYTVTESYDEIKQLIKQATQYPVEVKK